MTTFPRFTPNIGPWRITSKEDVNCDWSPPPPHRHFWFIQIVPFFNKRSEKQQLNLWSQDRIAELGVDVPLFSQCIFTVFFWGSLSFKVEGNYSLVKALTWVKIHQIAVAWNKLIMIAEQLSFGSKSGWFELISSIKNASSQLVKPASQVRNLGLLFIKIWAKIIWILGRSFHKLVEKSWQKLNKT